MMFTQGGPPAAPGAPPPGGPPPQGAAPGMMHPMAPPSPQAPAPGQAPISPDKLKLLELPTWEEVEALLSNPVHREFRIDIETDSTIAQDEDADREARIAFLEAMGPFLDKMTMVGQATPSLLPMMGEILMFAVRSFRAARSIEQAFEDAIESLEKQAQAPKPPPPEVQKAQIQAQTDITVARNKAQLDQQVESAKQQGEQQLAQLQQQLEAARAQHDAQLQQSLEQMKARLQSETDERVQQMKNDFEAQRVRFEGEVQVHVANIKAEADIRAKQLDLHHQGQQAEKDRAHEAALGKQKIDGEKDMESGRQKHEKTLAENEPAAKEQKAKADHGERTVKAIEGLADHLKRPRKVKRDAKGKIEGIE